MAVSTRGGRPPSHLQIPNKWRDSKSSPDRTISEPCGPNLPISHRKVPVVYYLSRNGQLEHPHFMEVPLSSPPGLFLIDVINRLNLLRGKGMASLYSWSSKRSYKTGFVWHDLTENDFIHPSHGSEYVLKGSELLDPPPLNTLALEAASSRSLRPPTEAQKFGDGFDSPPLIVRRRNKTWSSIDLNEYNVYKTESVGESSGKAAADASTQTNDKRHRRRVVPEEQDDDKVQGQRQREAFQSQSTELSRDEISPPPSDSSPETLESLMTAEGRLVICTNGANEERLSRTTEICPGGKMKASTVLMQLLSCGSISFKDCGSTAVREHGMSLIGQYKARLPRGVAGNQVETQTVISNLAGANLEDKEYFSGSLIETKKEAVPALKRSSSYNADRSAQLQLEETEKGGGRAKCIPRKPKAMPTKKETNDCITSSNDA